MEPPSVGTVVATSDPATGASVCHGVVFGLAVVSEVPPPPESPQAVSASAATPTPTANTLIGSTFMGPPTVIHETVTCRDRARPSGTYWSGRVVGAIGAGRSVSPTR